ncbi:MAG: DMT family transporter, partial [Desulfococcaceae bacterium]
EDMLRGYLFILIAASLWGVIGPLSRLAFQEGLAPLEVAFWRAALTWGVFAAHALLTRRVKMAPRDLPMAALFGLTGVTCFYGFYQLAVQGGGAALAAVLLYTAPAWVAIMSRLIFKERLTAVKLAALALTLLGVAGVSAGGDAGATVHTGPAAIGAGLAAGFCYALYYIFGKHFSGRYTSPNLFLYLLPIGALGLLPWVEFSRKTPTAWLALFLLALFSTYGAYYCYYLGILHLEATRAAIAATLEPVVAAVVAFFWWGEFFSPLGYVGGVLILCGVLLMVWDGMRIETAEKAGS